MRRLLALILALLWPVTASASGVTFSSAYPSIEVTLLNGLINTPGSSITMTTGANSPAGNNIVVIVGAETSVTINSVTDSASDTYTAGTAITLSSGQRVRPFYAFNAAHLAAGGTITATYSGSTSVPYISALTAYGIVTSSPLDVQGAGTVATGTTPSIATGTLGINSELIVGFGMVAAASSDSYSQAAGFSNGNSGCAASFSCIHVAYKIVGLNSSVTYAPALGTSRAYGFNVITFKGK